MRGPGRGLRVLGLAVLIGTAVGATPPGAGSADNTETLQRQAQALRRENATLVTGSQSALAGLATIEARLSQARAELAAFRARAAQVRERRRAVTNELRIARASLRANQKALAKRLQALYEERENDTLEVILGAGSLDAALNALETMDLAATQDQDLIEKTRSASARLVSAARALRSRERELEQLAAARAAAAASLADARAERLSALAAVRSRRQSNSGEIAALEARARTLASVHAATAPVPPRVPGAPQLAPGPATSGVRSLTVIATGYSLPGRTASGMPVGWGAVAVDPSVIPLGSRLSVPGYGLGVAADTGGAIQGGRIDLWFPTVGHARAWGSRVVTITVYSD